MGAFIMAGVVLAAGLGFAVLQLFAAGMSDVTDAVDCGARWTAIGAVVVAAIVASTHWLPNVGW